MTVAPPSRTIQIDRYGPFEIMEWRAVGLPPLGADEVRLRTLVGAVNGADLEIRSGRWPVQRDSPFPYTPGLEVVGEVETVGPGGDFRAAGRARDHDDAAARRHPRRAPRRLCRARHSGR